MKYPKPHCPLSDILPLVCLLMAFGAGEACAGQRLENQTTPEAIEADEPYNTGWQFYFDNDVFLGSTKDRNYTGGIALTLTGARAADYGISLDGWLGRLNSLTSFEAMHRDHSGFLRHSIEFGLIVFTPDDISSREPIADDYPYANLIFMANSRISTFPETNRMYQSSLLVGLLGTPVGEQVQKTIHRLTDSEEPQGWDNQISDGGELTFKHSLSMHQALLSQRGAHAYDLMGGLEGNLGFMTDVRASLYARIGKLRTPWWTFSPQQAEYINLGQTIGDNASAGPNPPELFLWGGLRVKYSFYNALLQGQFRDSAVTYSREQLESVIINASLGITKTFGNGLGLSFVAQRQTHEIKSAAGNDTTWGGLVVTMVY